MKKLLWGLVSLFFLGGCGSTPVKTETTRTSKPIGVTQNVEAKTASQISARRCEEVKTEMSLSELHGAILGCVKTKDWSRVEKLSMIYQERAPQSFIGLYYGSLASENIKNYDKALWLIELAIKKEPSLAVLTYQKGRILVLKNEMTEAQKTFSDAAKLQGRIPELILSQGIIAFNQKNCARALEQFSQLRKEELTDQDGVIAYTECLGEKSQADLAVSYIKDKLRGDIKNYEYWLQLARLHEVYRKNMTDAMKSFEEASKLVTQGEIRAWIKQKIAYLQKQSQNVRNISSQGGPQ